MKVCLTLFYVAIGRLWLCLVEDTLEINGQYQEIDEKMSTSQFKLKNVIL